ncbi:hypothetical protein CERZMDRAFT_83470 [Cercospora zeae-maydis SCOH1-5]|uniref:Uncharacterized protein n=1 Tax=Cercospora zeae-maydis SCOH1-5 TaxID=717836 RepID=A0A6A6FL34_9PEZI|nr:hypothetical protein CERZMDRAFT_83470 [Cercospora zeae-maydis SCOH1-5]
MRVAANASLLVGMLQLSMLGWTTYNLIADHDSMSVATFAILGFFIIGAWGFRRQLEMTQLRCCEKRFLTAPIILILLPFGVCDLALGYTFAMYALDFRSPIQARARPLLISLTLSLICSVMLTIYGASVTCRAVMSHRTIRKKAASIEVLSGDIRNRFDDRYEERPFQRLEENYWIRDRHTGVSRLRSSTFRPRCFIAYWLLWRPILLVSDLTLAIPAFRFLFQLPPTWAGAWAPAASGTNFILLFNFAITRELQRIPHHLIVTPSDLTAPHMAAAYIVLFTSSLDLCQMALVVRDLQAWYRMWPKLDDDFSLGQFSGDEVWGASCSRQ